jgi:hypothetical protein
MAHETWNAASAQWAEMHTRDLPRAPSYLGSSRGKKHRKPELPFISGTSRTNNNLIGLRL